MSDPKQAIMGSPVTGRFGATLESDPRAVSLIDRIDRRRRDARRLEQQALEKVIADHVAAGVTLAEFAVYEFSDDPWYREIWRGDTCVCSSTIEVTGLDRDATGA